MKIWLGDESGLQSLFEVQELFKQKIVNGTADKLKLSEDDDDSFGNPVGYKKEGSVAVLSIEGSTVSRTSMFSRYFGVASYDDIRERLNAAIDDKEVRAIVLALDSNGGQADGVQQISEEIRAINNKLKPVVSVNQGSMASAAYWYGSSASMVVGEPNTKAGSIGVILMHAEFSEAHKKAGINVSVFRTSPYKAIVNSVEPLSDKAKEMITEEMDLIHKSFVNGIADNRGLDAGVVQKQIATGKMYRVKEAIDLKMIDRVGSLGEVVAKLNAKFENTGAR